MANEKTEITSLAASLREFSDARDWNQFHSPRNLAAALIVEAAELLEQFQWLTDEQSSSLSEEQLLRVRHEVADVLIYLVRLADKLGIDLIAAAREKIALNEEKYPVNRSRGVSKKYTDF